jgi:hypothetical protein
VLGGRLPAQAEDTVSTPYEAGKYRPLDVVAEQRNDAGAGSRGPNALTGLHKSNRLLESASRIGRIAFAWHSALAHGLEVACLSKCHLRVK